MNWRTCLSLPRLTLQWIVWLLMWCFGVIGALLFLVVFLLEGRDDAKSSGWFLRGPLAGNKDFSSMADNIRNRRR